MKTSASKTTFVVLNDVKVVSTTKETTFIHIARSQRHSKRRIMNDEFLKKAMDWASINKPDASMSHKAAFANSVAYLCSGWSGGYGGPSLREHFCSWALAGDEGLNETASLNGLTITIQFPDGKLPRAGHWNFEEAIKFCEPLCFEPAEKYLKTLLLLQISEHCFDDDPEDIKVLRGK